MQPAHQRTAIRLLWTLACGVLAACNRDPVASGANGNAARPQKPAEPSLLHEKMHAWTQQDAVRELRNESNAVSAAFRLLELGHATHPAVSTPPTNDEIRGLRLVWLSKELAALGRTDWRRDYRLLDPILLRTDGSVETPAIMAGLATSQPATGSAPADTGPASQPAHAGCVLMISADAEVYPHLLLWRTHVAVVENIVRPAITLLSPETVGFDLRRNNEIPYLCLVVWDQDPPTLSSPEAARYLWDHYELSFAGPRMDVIPDPPGGKFEIDLPRSPLLIPQGGLINVPDEPEMPEPEPEIEEEIGDLPPPA